MADGYYLYVDLRYIGCIIRVVEKIQIDKIIGVQETPYTYWLSPQKRIANMRSVPDSNRGIWFCRPPTKPLIQPTEYVANVVNYPFIENLFIVFLGLIQGNGVCGSVRGLVLVPDGGGFRGACLTPTPPPDSPWHFPGRG